MRLVRLSIYTGSLIPVPLLLAIALGNASLTLALGATLFVALALLHVRYLVAVNQNDMRDLYVGEYTTTSPLALLLKINPFILLGGYKVYKVYPPIDDNPYSGNKPFILITDRTYLKEGDRVLAYRLQNDIYLEA
jgi:hypothetical protein